MGSVTLQDVGIELAMAKNDTSLVLEEVDRFCANTLTFMNEEHEEKEMNLRLANYERVCVKAEMVLDMLRKYNKRAIHDHRRREKLNLGNTRKPMVSGRS